jgi:formate-dependent nitrite reductase membrane component NrfD
MLASFPQKLLAIPGSVLGIFLGGYTGVLLTVTSIPLWSRSKVLGAVFISSAVSTSSALISLVLSFTRTPTTVLHKLERMEWVALLLEMAGLFAFLRGSGRAARPLVGTGPTEQGRTFWAFVTGIGLVLPWILQTLSLWAGRSKKRRGGSGIVISLLVLVGGYFLRRTMIEAGHTSSADARTTLWNAKR